MSVINSGYLRKVLIFAGNSMEYYKMKLQAFLLTFLWFAAGCAPKEKIEDDSTICGTGYGSITIEARSDLVRPGRLTEGELKFSSKGQSTGVDPYIAAATLDNRTAIAVLGGSDACVSEGRFCVITAESPRISITDVVTVGGKLEVSQYVSVSGTMHILQKSPFVVRLEDVAMRVAPYEGNRSSGSFDINGILCSGN